MHDGTLELRNRWFADSSAGAEWIRTFGSAMRWHRRQRGRGVTRLIRAVSGGSSDRPPQLDWYTGTMPVAIL